MTDLFSVLGADHERIFGLSNTLTGGASVPSVSPKERKAVADKLVEELSRHEAVEEMLLWPAVKERAEGGARMNQVALEQEANGKRLLNALAHITPDNEEFDTIVHTIAGVLREHISYEQNIVWPKLRLTLTAEEAGRLGSEAEKAKRRAPTRPHPHVPPDPALLKALAPAAAVIDKVRNAMIR